MNAFAGAWILVAGVLTGATLQPGELVTLCREGEGQWDLTVLRGKDTDAPYGLPSGICVDNAGRVCVADTFGDRVLRFASDGTPLDQIADPRVYHPNRLEIGEDNVLLITSVPRRTGDPSQWEVNVNDSKLTLEVVPACSVRASDGRTYSGAVGPFGANGLRYLQSSAGVDKPQLLLVDSKGEYVKAVPSPHFDQRGRFYRSMPLQQEEKGQPGVRAVGVFDQSGKLLGRIIATGDYMKLHGWVYFMDQTDEETALLRRYAADGSVEHEITVEGCRLNQFYVSPNDGHIMWISNDFADGGVYRLRMQRYTYREE